MTPPLRELFYWSRPGKRSIHIIATSIKQTPLIKGTLFFWFRCCPFYEGSTAATKETLSRLIERFSIKCRKTKTKVITLTYHRTLRKSN